jgi:hypothetical protein
MWSLYVIVCVFSVYAFVFLPIAATLFLFFELTHVRLYLVFFGMPRLKHVFKCL